MKIHTITPGSVCVEAPAKINLFLEVRNRRPDGYHEINSLFQAVSLHDRLTLHLTDEPGVALTIDGPGGLTAGEDNLVVRAIRLTLREAGLSRGVQAHLEKRIPVAAGLGGGSSDGAAAIEGLSELLGLGLSRSDKMRLGLQLGSDIPFFFTSGQALVRGRGEVMEETDYPVDYHLILVNPGFPVSTADGYASLKRGLTASADPFTLPCSRTVQDFVLHLSRGGNDFEPVLRRAYPELGEIVAELRKRGAVVARLSGSGPTVFGLFLDRTASETMNEADWGKWQIYAVMPVSLPAQASK